MSGHVSISLPLTIYVLYRLLSKLNDVPKRPIVFNGVLMIMLTAPGIYFTIGNRANAGFRLYNNEINLKYDRLMNEGIKFTPRGSSIALSKECFDWSYQFQVLGE